MNGFENWMLNPMTQMGLGILAANKPGASFGQAVGGGGLLGLQNWQEQQAYELKKRQLQQQLEKEEASRLARQRFAEANPELGLALDAYPAAASQIMASKYRKPSGYGTTIQYVRDTRTKQVMPAQASQSGGLFIPNPDGSFSPFDPSTHELIKPFSPQDIGGALIPFQPMTGQFGSSQPMYQPGQSLLAPGETLAPDSPLDQYGMPRSSAGGIAKTLPPEQRPETKGAQTTAVKEAEEAVKKKANFGKVRSSLNTFERQTNVARQNIKDIINMYGDWTAWTPDFIANLPMSKARAIQNKLNTVRGNIGFQALQEMRSNSPTGGALGQVAIQELESLQGVLGTMDWRDREFIPTLQRIDEILSGMANTARSAFEQDYGTGNSVDNLLKKYGVQ